MTEDAPVAVSEEPKAELTEEEKLKKRAEKFGATDAVMVNSGSTANLLMLSLLKWKYNLNKWFGS